MKDELLGPILGNSPAIARVRRQIAKLAPARISVLIEGATGTGKELVARALHGNSGRCGPFVAVNLCAIPDGLFEATVFGHVRGAFTGAERESAGYFEQARGGTLFLDELSGLSPLLQGKLLRALESRRIRRVGGKIEIEIDVRVVSATNVPVESLIAAGALRLDLAHRLAVAKVNLPSLTERREDVELLARHFARQASDLPFGPVSFTSEALALLRTYHWPGNVRELRNAVETAILLADGNVISRDDVSVQLLGRWDWSLKDTAEPETMRDALAAYGNGTVQLARAFGVHRTTIWRRRQRLGLNDDTSPANGEAPEPGS